MSVLPLLSHSTEIKGRGRGGSGAATVVTGFYVACVPIVYRKQGRTHFGIRRSVSLGSDSAIRGGRGGSATVISAGNPAGPFVGQETCIMLLLG